MGIRITDQPGDQHTQNPPPEHDPSLGEGQTKTVASVTAEAPGAATAVIRGAHRVSGLCLIEECDVPTTAPRASDVGEHSVTQADSPVDVQVCALGWVRRDTGATRQIGAVEDHIVRKLPPRWTVAPTSVTDQITRESNKISQ
jgi:hypothetical protein